MAVHNQILLNAAVGGALGGLFSQRKNTDPTAADYVSQKNVAAAIANAVDQAIPADAAIITPIDQYTEARAQLLQSLVAAYFDNSYPQSTDQAFYATAAAAIVAQYAEGSLALG